jgi:hypothetical protein
MNRAVPFGPEAGEDMAWLYFGNGMGLLQEMYDQAGFSMKILPCAVIAPEAPGWFATEINLADDLRGLKMCFLGVGFATSLLPGGEIFPVLEKGALDAIAARVLFGCLLSQTFPKLDETQWHFYPAVTMIGIILVASTGFGPKGAILFFVFLLGFVLDWVEITLIVLPLIRRVWVWSFRGSVSWMIRHWSGS